MEKREKMRARWEKNGGWMDRWTDGWKCWAGWERESEQGRGRAIFMSSVRRSWGRAVTAPHRGHWSCFGVDRNPLFGESYYSDCQNAHTRFAFCVPRQALAWSTPRTRACWCCMLVALFLKWESPKWYQEHSANHCTRKIAISVFLATVLHRNPRYSLYLGGQGALISWKRLRYAFQFE